MPKALQIAVISATVLLSATLAAQSRYQTLSPAMQKILDTKEAPALDVAPNGKYACLVQLRKQVPLNELARPMLRLAGHRINPASCGAARPAVMDTLQILELPGGRIRKVELPEQIRLSPPQWSPDGRKFAMLGSGDKESELWIGDPASGFLRKVPGIRVNGLMGNTFNWLPGGRLVVKGMPQQYVETERDKAPSGPRIQEHDPKKVKGEPLGAFQDLLQSPKDEALFDQFATCQLFFVDLISLTAQPFGIPGLLDAISASPDGKFLLVSLVKRPYSYQVPSSRFPHTWEIWAMDGTKKRVAEIPLIEGLPIGGVRQGPRDLAWIPTEKSTLCWIEALDEGNPRLRATFRDKLMTIAPPFHGPAKEWLQTEQRLEGLQWLEKGRILLRESDPLRDHVKIWLVEAGTMAKRALWEFSTQNRSQSPGKPLTRPLPNGQPVIREEEGKILLSGIGATTKGHLPFLNRFDLLTGKTEPLFIAGPQGFEECVQALDKGSFITRRESASEPPNFYLHTPNNPEKRLTSHADTTPELRSIKKDVVRFQRSDGMELSFTLHLPPDYKTGEKRPTLVWLNPVEYGQEDGSGAFQRFTHIQGCSPLSMLLKGYVVLMDATVPVIGDPETVNDSFLEQVIDSANATLNKAASLGCVDPDRVAVGGHGPGAFMAANLLCHTQLFKCGIARSGAYNRTLTPFGFQSERRSLWEAPETYLRLSPFMNADKFKAPILLIHGEADNNPISFPLQSEQLFRALKGNNQAVRYVSLPLESHQYASKESNAHVVWEMEHWLEKHLKGQIP